MVPNCYDRVWGVRRKPTFYWGNDKSKRMAECKITNQSRIERRKFQFQLLKTTSNYTHSIL